MTALQLAAGQVGGRGLADVFADAEAAAAREDARELNRQRRREMFGEPEPEDDGWPQSVRDLDRQLRLHESLTESLNHFRAKANYPRALKLARAKQRRRDDEFIERRPTAAREDWEIWR